MTAEWNKNELTQKIPLKMTVSKETLLVMNNCATWLYNNFMCSIKTLVLKVSVWSYEHAGKLRAASATLICFSMIPGNCFPYKNKYFSLLNIKRKVHAQFPTLLLFKIIGLHKQIMKVLQVYLNPKYVKCHK